jgi:3-oxoacyl-[acyl-carrier protein] reductase
MSEKKLLQGKNIIVTGSRRGMGRQMITTFAENGANIFAHARTQDDEHDAYCASLSDRCGVKVMPVYFDMADESAIKDGIRTIRAEKMPIDGLVNNAGITYTALLSMTSSVKLREIMNINFVAPYIICQYISKMMVKNKRGSIVNISSSSALDGNPGMSAYGASKAALVCMTKSLAAEIGDSNVRVNAICPGVTDTDMLCGMKENIYNIQKNASFLKKIATPLDITNMAMLLLSDMSEYVTGQVFSVDGGITEYNKR